MFRYLGHSQLTSIESGDFTGLGNLTTLFGLFLLRSCLVDDGMIGHRYLGHNQITSIESGDFLGLGNLTLLFVCVDWGPSHKRLSIFLFPIMQRLDFQ
jgi:hypothetical protein